MATSLVASSLAAAGPKTLCPPRSRDLRECELNLPRHEGRYFTMHWTMFALAKRFRDLGSLFLMIDSCFITARYLDMKIVE